MARPQNDINFHSVCVVPNEYTQRFEYAGDQTILYAGHAAKGTDESTDAWTVQKFEYVSQQVTSITIGYGSWTNRASLVYD